MRVAVPDRVPEGGERLVQPDRSERPARHHVAEPVVGELVRDRVLVREDRQRLLVARRGVERIALLVEVRLAQAGHRRRLHRADREVAQEHLVVLDPRVRVAHPLGEELDHLRRVAERVLRRLLDPGPAPDRERHGGGADLRVGQGNAGEIADVDRHEVVRDRLLLDPAEGARAVRVLARRIQHAVAHGREPARHRHDELDREAVVRVVVDRQPGVVQAALAVVPGLRFVPLRLREEVHPDARVDRVRDLHGRVAAEHDGLAERDVEAEGLRVERERERLAVALDLVDAQARRVERKVGQRRTQRLEGHRRDAGDLFFGHVEPQLRLVALDVVRPIPHRPLRPLGEAMAGQHLGRRGKGGEREDREGTFHVFSPKKWPDLIPCPGRKPIRAGPDATPPPAFRIQGRTRRRNALEAPQPRADDRSRTAPAGFGGRRAVGRGRGKVVRRRRLGGRGARLHADRRRRAEERGRLVPPRGRAARPETVRRSHRVPPEGARPRLFRRRAASPRSASRKRCRATPTARSRR